MVTGSVETIENGKAALIKVTDDGIGIEAQELAKLNTLLSDDKKLQKAGDNEDPENSVSSHDSIKGGSHFGLYSVSHRIKLYFGKEYGASIDSTVGEGTTVFVTLPYNER